LQRFVLDAAMKRDLDTTQVAGGSGAPALAGTALSLERITHRYGSAIAVDDVALEIGRGELVALLGPSGCGKTTLLRIIAGLLRQTEGHVLIDGAAVDALPPNERGAGIVFQNYALFPHMTVQQNVGYGLRARGASKAEIDATVERMLALVKMDALRGRYPRQLSGGQQQRVALARTLAVAPRVLLLDEPFAALDKNLRLDMQIEVKRIQRELAITTIMVTHDQEEALSMADRVAVMDAGRVEQFAPPESIYDHPESLFVAQFIGTANLIKGRLHAGLNETGGFDFEPEVGGSLKLASARPCSRSGAAMLSVRPEHWQLLPADAPAGLPATVRMVLPLGPTVVHELELADGTPIKVTTVRSGNSTRLQAGAAVRVGLGAQAAVAVFQA
jgi:putative spermidine/putrescine transport system ATP-binding protein